MLLQKIAVTLIDFGARIAAHAIQILVTDFSRRKRCVRTTALAELQALPESHKAPGDLVAEVELFVGLRGHFGWLQTCDLFLSSNSRVT